MIEIERHIEILLLSNDCVIVPGLGGFMAHHVAARYDEIDGTFVPPLRTLGFTPHLTMNDSLLVQSYIETYDISYPEALRRIEAEVMELRQHLETEGSYELTGIGVLSLNQEGNMEFEPCEAGILTPELYGLGTVEMKPLAKLSAGASSDRVGEVAQTNNDRAIVLKLSWLRHVVVAAAAVITFFMIGSPVVNSDLSYSGVQQSSFIPVPGSHADVSEEQEQVEQDIDEPAADSDVQLMPVLKDSVEGAADSAVVAEEPTGDVQESTVDAKVSADNAQEAADNNDAPKYCIVMASQVTQRNAESFVSMLEAKGFHEATIIMTKFRRVVYGSYSTEEEAVKSLRELRAQSSYFKESWVMMMPKN